VTSETARPTPLPDDQQGGASSSGVAVSEVTEVSDELVEAFTRLIPQLSSSSPPPHHADLSEMVSSAASVLLVARDTRGTIVGSLTLALFRVPTGLRAWIEDVVVDESARGAGVGEALVMAAVHRADHEGARSVDLTSRPSRKAANRLYQRLGFEARSTNVYRWNAPVDGAGST
jgi:ribosomal protein S18 acetylase RimI-like enzyme